ncbi:hypothetical protein [Streptomyces sp. ODS28]|uniref:hypothetical protein n=1 Tax=Streptomyces sp. ODS28 TaxID=3136688 RepID=UPI0031F150A1
MNRPAQSRRWRTALALGMAGAFALLASGCGIRATSVPVDAGSAPSRVGCVLPGEEKGPDGADKAQARPAMRVFLVCGSRVSPVERRVDIPDKGPGGGRLTMARALLQELQRAPSEDERTAGFETDVPRDLTVSGPAPGDPSETLRLSRPLDDLRSFAVAQLVCTYADTAAADANEAVTLGGPADAKERPQRFECGTALRTSPEAAATAGNRV